MYVFVCKGGGERVYRINNNTVTIYIHQMLFDVFFNTFLQSIISYFHLEFSFALNVSVDTFNFYDFISYHLTPNRPVFTPCLKIYVNDPLLPPSPSYFYIQSFSMTKYVGWTEFVHVYFCVSVPALQPKQQPILIKVYGLENMGQCFFFLSQILNVCQFDDVICRPFVLNIFVTNNNRMDVPYYRNSP